MNDYINQIVHPGSEDQRYNCGCMIPGDNYAYEDYVGFWLSGAQLRKLWNGLESRISRDCNVDFQFDHANKVSLTIITRYKDRADHYMKLLGAPVLFTDNDKV